MTLCGRLSVRNLLPNNLKYPIVDTVLQDVSIHIVLMHQKFYDNALSKFTHFE